jgi:hypothetical protein
MWLDLRPSPGRKNNDSEESLPQVLLVGKIAVSSHHDIEAILLRSLQQFAVLERRPAQLRRPDYLVMCEETRKRTRRVLIE